MAKPDAALLDPERYPFRCATEPRFADLYPEPLDIHVAATNI
ncbi:MAG: hypothetical protein R3E09_01475 [Novosphingobium sp.]